MLLASCTLLVPIDDDLTSGSRDAGPGGPGASTDGALVESGTEGGAPADAGMDALEPYDSGEVFGAPRDGCPNGVSQDPDLDAYYPFDETSGSVLHDCSLKAHDLSTLTNAAPKWSDGHIHGAGDFDGNDGCFGATDASLDAFDENQAFSISVWVNAREYFEKNADKSGRWIVSHKVSPRGWHIGTDDPNRVELDLEWNDGTDNRKSEISAVTALNEWHHYVATYSAGERKGAMYKDGDVIASQSGEKIPTAFKATATTFFRIGCRNMTTGVFNGKLDELRIYPRVIDDARIKQLAAAR